jgi:hypothetical protein
MKDLKLLPILWLFLMAFSFASSTMALTGQNLDAPVVKTDLKSLPYEVDKIVVRGFDGVNPPPRLGSPDRPLFYGYGITAYCRTVDSLLFFTLIKLDAVHRDENGESIRGFPLKGCRYNDYFKPYFLELTENQ